ncbi:shikimate dehydrogenase [Oecophyllibacter saccharovorans]|uniref:shikimate dehydrogenase n=1 Tax=Oecophyllibacter saccharovorans TaxID=2558360 RepID=UPI001142386B|nr:shikimate dehydrogenase [Oecophyllibacter saccharovorans]QDH14579.1 shikimate dehydrogenase [Oecophyllibacter saccharovorans]
MLDGHTRLAGVIGWPVSHSRSPLMHNYWCQRYGVNGAYVPLPVAPGALEPALRGLAASGFRGVNVTIPHKEAAFALCDELSLTARRAGAVNTICFRDGKIIGDCTDGSGFCDNLEAHGVSGDGKRPGNALILGAGGAARAIAAALLDRGWRVCLTNRSADRAVKLVAVLGGEGNLEQIPWESWPQALERMDLVVNATSLGMEDRSEAAGPDQALVQSWKNSLAHAAHDLCVADIVYTPRRTALLQAAEEHGLKTVDGLGMLIHQARLGFEAWFGTAPAIDSGLVALLEADLGKG